MCHAELKNIPKIRIGSFTKNLNSSQNEFTEILLLLETHLRPIGDPSETDMPDRRPIGVRHA